MIKLLVVDNHPIIRKGIELLFTDSADIKVVGGVSNGEAIFEFLNQEEADILLCEIDLPQLNGITALRRLKNEFPKVKMLMFTAQPESIYALNTLKVGAQGFIHKSANVTTIKEAILKVNKGEKYISDSLAAQMDLGKRANKSPGSIFKKLSTREVEVLKLINIGKKNKEIAKELNINEKTVSTYKARLMKKLQVDNIVDLISRSKILEF